MTRPSPPAGCRGLFQLNAPPSFKEPFFRVPTGTSLFSAAAFALLCSKDHSERLTQPTPAPWRVREAHTFSASPAQRGSGPAPWRVREAHTVFLGIDVNLILNRALASARSPYRSTPARRPRLRFCAMPRTQNSYQPLFAFVRGLLVFLFALGPCSGRALLHCS